MQHLSRRISPATLFMLSMNGIIGSGWLFAPLYAAKIAGPAAIISWMIGGFAAILIALTFAELSTMLPVAGGSAHIPQLSHGAFASFILSWIAWITSLMLTPIEVQAVLQYASLFFPALMHETAGTATLTLWGYGWAGILMLSLCILNIVSYQGLVRFNFILFVFKFSVMILTVFAILHVRFNPANFSGMMSSTLSIHGWQSILSAVATGGVVLAFNGFKSGVEMAGEAKKLAIAIPLSTAGSVLACLLLYLGLQICFIGALDPAALAGGWRNLNFTGDIGPFVGLAAGLGLVWLLKLLYVNAVISPLGAGLIYVTATARILYAMSRIGYVPKFLSRLNHQRFPIWAIVANFLFGMLSFLPLPGWQAMVNFLVSAVVITYAMGPIALMCLRLTLPDKERPFRLPAANILCLVAFYCCNLFSYWTGWETISKLGITLLVGIFLFAMAYLRGSVKMEKQELKSAYWMIPYLLGLVSISYLGSFGGINLIPFGWDFLVIALFSIGILYMAIKSRVVLSAEDMKKFLVSESLVAERV
ncbi:APC family permease [Aquicella lusitana]|uniref:Amino acid permease n=1 Tax=Aquicella lusitana TaxID=254246 RepID=A0A370G536_9COXI|nr:APC family permease [Aquicella lusitana]RDI38951.1 amino acid permease [Aquicella lusitana]VVC74300.1 Aspartate-proton symporter [Aquicella lusitana]